MEMNGEAAAEESSLPTRTLAWHFGLWAALPLFAACGDRTVPDAAEGPRPTSEALTINATGVYVETRGRP